MLRLETTDKLSELLFQNRNGDLCVVRNGVRILITQQKFNQWFSPNRWHGKR